MVAECLQPQNEVDHERWSIRHWKQLRYLKLPCQLLTTEHLARLCYWADNGAYDISCVFKAFESFTCVRDVGTRVDKRNTEALNLDMGRWRKFFSRWRFGPASQLPLCANTGIMPHSGSENCSELYVANCGHCPFVACCVSVGVSRMSKPRSQGWLID